MIRVGDIKLSLEQVANAKEILITDIREVREYVDGKRTDNIIGYAYEVAAPKNKYEKFSIKVEEKSPVITAEELEAKGGVAKPMILWVPFTIVAMTMFLQLRLQRWCYCEKVRGKCTMLLE